MTVQGNGNAGSAAAAAAAAAAEAARKAAEEAARKAAEVAAKKAAAEAAKQQQEAARKQQADKVRDAVSDKQQADGVGALDKHAGPRGAKEIGEAPEDDSHDEFAGFGRALDKAGGPSLDEVQNDPEAVKDLQKLAKSDDPDDQAKLKEHVQGLVQESLERNLGNPGDQKDPNAVFDGFKRDLGALAQATGLGSVIKDASQGAVTEVAKDLLNQGVNSDAVAKNPALGKVLASLQNDPDPAVKEKLHDTVRGWTTAALNRNLDGKKGKDDVEDALKGGFKDDVAKLAQDTGLGNLLQETAKESLEGQKDRIEDAAKDGGGGILGGIKSAIGSIGDFLGDVVGGVADAVGDVVHAATDVAGDAVNAVTDIAGDAVEGVTDFAGDAANAATDLAGQGFHAATNVAGGVTGGVLDVAGFHGAADSVRETSDRVGALGEEGLDRLGDLQNAALDTAGQIQGGIIHGAGDIASGTLHTAGAVVDTTLDIAGAIAADGPYGAAEKLADKAIGPEKPEYKDQIDGFTGIITNRLGKGDAVFLRAEVTGEVGVGLDAGASVNGQGASAEAGLYAGAKLTGGATLSRNQDGKIELALEVGGGVESGVKAGAEAGAGGTASVEGKAGLAAEGRGKITLEFDPNKPEDVQRLKAITEPSPGKLLAAAANPLGAAVLEGAAVADAIKHNEKSRELGVSAGVKAEAKAKAEFGALKAEAKVNTEDVIGASKKFNKDGTTETTFFFRAGASASASVDGGKAGVEAQAGVQHVQAVTIKKDADGNVIGLSGAEDDSSGASVGPIGKASQNDGANKQKLSGLGGGTSVTTHKQELTGPGLAEAQRRIAAGENPLSVFNALNDDPGNVKESTQTIDTDSVTVGFKAEAALGVKVEVGAKATLGKSHTTVVEGDGHDPTTIERDLAARGGGARNPRHE